MTGPAGERPTLAGVPSPQTLPYETASWGRRALALIVDWIASTFVVVLFMGWSDYSRTGGPGSVYVLIVFVLESAALTCTAGGSFGKLATRLRVINVETGGRLDPLRSLAREILVALVIPPLVFRPDRRGLHDIAAGSATVTLQVMRAAG
ncbi:putative RDD family membrane protein YckC [Nocardioides sp. HB32]